MDTRVDEREYKLGIELPSPLDPIQGISENQSWFVKRDDLIHPFISGNKWRKLKYNLARAVRQHNKGIVTWGGPYSNHLLAIAYACQRLDLKAVGYLKKRYAGLGGHFMDLFSLLGMELRYVESNRQRSDSESEENYLRIPMGGYNDDGMEGVRDMVGEVYRQKPGRSFHWFVPAGSACTALGIMAAANEGDHIHIYPVFRRKGIIAALHRTIASAAENSGKQFEFLTGPKLAFGRVDEDFLRFIIGFYRQSGLLLDPLYNGKMAYSIFGMGGLKSGPFPNDCLFVHTGGLHGWWGMMERYPDIGGMDLIREILMEEKISPRPDSITG